MMGRGNTSKDFWSHIDQSRDCWEWQLSRDKDGYGKAKWKNKDYKAHRLAWILTYGEIPNNCCVLHSCDNPPCCNPNHLFLGTKKDNVYDMITKGRGKRPNSKGEHNGNAKLTLDDIVEIRQRYARGDVTQQELANEKDVTDIQISRIIRRERWKD